MNHKEQQTVSSLLLSNNQIITEEILSFFIIYIFSTLVIILLVTVDILCLTRREQVQSPTGVIASLSWITKEQTVAYSKQKIIFIYSLSLIFFVRLVGSKYNHLRGVIASLSWLTKEEEWINIPKKPPFE